MAVMNENCKQVKKSPHILRNLPLGERTVSGSEIIGNTIVLNSGDSIVACATVILPGVPLLRVSFHASPFEGHIHIVPFQNKARILPDLKYDSVFDNEDLKKGILSWKFVAECQEKMSADETLNENELGVDSRASFTIELCSEVPKYFTVWKFIVRCEASPWKSYLICLLHQHPRS
ncbi:hypothetical protein KIN20_022831 [Parelaphostrongylus tenuis]|uniref:Uncharacterized protein n=1 Tax=Parelaphostrongylus tenuis TaxID=148309 RepID=A0AAD5N6H9_PARTN|nr:hypothetical protein KIN20_022831 [Parelaphostrongylus tenuis]